MNFAEKSAWIYKETDPEVEKAAKYGIKTVYVDPRSANAPQVVSKLRAAGITAGAYFARDWQPTMTAIELAAWISQRLNALLPKTAAGAPPVMLDMEVGGNTKFAADLILAYRAHQPARPTAYTNAPFQGGYVPYVALQQRGMPFFVQLYYGGMQPADAAAAILEASRNMNPRDVFPFYDGAHPTADQREGCYFTLERMP